MVPGEILWTTSSTRRVPPAPDVLPVRRVMLLLDFAACNFSKTCYAIFVLQKRFITKIARQMINEELLRINEILPMLNEHIVTPAKKTSTCFAMVK